MLQMKLEMMKVPQDTVQLVFVANNDRGEKRAMKYEKENIR